MAYKITEYDSLLKNYQDDLALRVNSYKAKKKELLKKGEKLIDFANGADYFGIHRVRGGWVYREWAPAASALHFTGDFNEWNPTSHPMEKLENGIWEITLKGAKALWDGCKVKTLVTYDGKTTEHIPLYAHRVVQDPETNLWAAEVYCPKKEYSWTDEDFKVTKTPVIYECHIGMAQEKYGVGSYKEFTENILPRIKEDGYNTIQIMAIMEHPYYGSFGYQVSNFYAASSRYGMPEDLKELVDTAHSMGITVLLDVVHSHAVKNTAEGINEFDGTSYQFFHEGGKGDHSAWDTKLFNYGKNEVIHFLLSNLKYWMMEYHFDGFRFDGVTSMLYHDHGLGSSFDHYDKYFSMNTDMEAVVYLMLANELIHQIKRSAISIAEDMSGMPGMCVPISQGGMGFDYRLSMGVPDMWIRLLKNVRDEDWDMWGIWYELTGRRPHEKVIGYAESHDQALVGDKTIMFRLCDQEMYWNMGKDSKNNIVIDRGIALHKVIRLLTYSLVGDGYLNFMGNEFGHPEWIDFPREGNNWSYHYCRRQWSLVDNQDLKYHWLGDFDKAMIALGTKDKWLTSPSHNLWVHQGDKVLVYEKNGDIIVVNLNPTRSFTGYFIPTDGEGTYKAVLSTDEGRFGGFDRVDEKIKYTCEKLPDGRSGFLTYIPCRTATVFRKTK